MIPVRKKLQALIHDNEQDRMNADQWWRTSTLLDKVAVWNRIQIEHGDDAVQELVTRFAQLAFGEMAERDARANGETP